MIDTLFAVSYLIRRSKINYEDVIRSFVIFNENADLEHPIIIVKENLESCTIKFKNLEYNFDDFKEALDIYLKMHSVFEIKYEKVGIHVLAYFQYFFFKTKIGFSSVNLTKLLNLSL